MNEIIKAMEERRSIRKFKPDMPTKEDLEQIIEAGLYAANGMGKQATITIAVTNKKFRDRLSAINAKIGGWKEGFDPFYGAPAILIVLADKNWANRVYDGSLVMGNMMLAAHSLNLGSIWIHRAKAYFDAKTKIHLLNYIESRTDNNIALFVSLNKPYSRLTESGVELRLREMGKKLGVEKVHPHKFRRTMDTRAIEKGMPIEQVQKILGHEQIDTTLRYAMVN